ncbi:S41 family peptidase [Sporosarcina thermotolerans]|uniref:S41 family peptidase n=1 Tax=Sporosarcina thermotolerans TaxID=633404 RepID=A0AAW9A3L9_9BACL|nr:S41 family peptidase [Sporosarcina thermotolerans]MDW0115427.1 S41 family peptidase [Sporosarcina thermotolerans]WHT47245.1 S41 family peptidase [Sporosarcina thermotolerans]
MDEKENNVGQENEKNYEPPAKRFIKLKPFSLVMLIFGLVLTTAGVTFFALTTGEDKVVEVVSPQNPTIERKEFKKLFDAYDELKKTYFNDIDDTAVIDGAINGMIDALGDPFSDYLNEKEAKQLNESISSSFQGIGAEIQELNGYINIVSPIKNSPAERAGLLPNDLIIAVDGKSIQGMSSSEAVLLIRGEKGTTVTLTVRRGEMSEPFDVLIERDVIPIETVYTEMLEDNIAHIRITSFSEHTYEELLSALDEMEAKGMEGLIVDVRQNPGGMLNTAIDISDLFVEKNKNLFQYQGKGNNPEVYVASNGRKVKVPVAMIIDDGSASASEILAGALKESANVPLVGIKTYGKGTVQTPKNLSDGSNLKLTTAKWLTPDGNWIHEKGIEPDIEVQYPTYAMLPFLDPTMEMKDGMISPLVKTAEEMLSAVGFDPGDVDGLFDQNTEEAVKSLQRELSIDEDGILVGDTTFGLMNRLRTKMHDEDPQLLKAKEILLETIKK